MSTTIRLYSSGSDGGNSSSSSGSGSNISINISTIISSI